jgi:uncharacterized protein (DUF1330 family)
MSAYFVAIKIETTNQAEMDIYSQKAGPTLHGHAATPKTLYGSIRNTDGTPVEGTLIIEFPSFKEAEIWYDSPAYQEVVVHRFAGAKYTTFIVEGV